MISDRERKECIKAMRAYTKKISKSKEAVKNHFIKAGILTPKGNLRRRYRNLSILLGQGQVSK